MPHPPLWDWNGLGNKSALLLFLSFDFATKGKELHSTQQAAPPWVRGPNRGTMGPRLGRTGQRTLEQRPASESSYILLSPFVQHHEPVLVTPTSDRVVNCAGQSSSWRRKEDPNEAVSCCPRGLPLSERTSRRSSGPASPSPTSASELG